MLYIIGGAPRAGKSLLAQKISVEKCTPYFPLDVFIGALDTAFPEMKINHQLPFIEKAKTTWKMNEHALTHFLYNHDSYLIEGDCLLPQDIHEFMTANEKEMRVCYLGYATEKPEEKLQDIRTYHRGETDWTHRQSDEELLYIIGKAIEYSKLLKDECKKYSIPYFDVSNDFEGAQLQAFVYLMES